MPIHKPALLVYSFGAKDRDVSYFRALWSICQGESPPGLGMALPAGGLAPTKEFPENINSANHFFRIIAGAERRSSASAKDSVYAFEYLDSLGLCAGLAPDDGKTKWRALLAQWLDARKKVGGQGPAFGESLVFYGLHDCEMEGRLRESLELELPHEAGFNKGICPSYTDNDQLYVWELGRTESLRMIAVLAPVQRDRSVTELLYWRDSVTLPTLPRFLLHAGKAQYHHQLYQREAPKLREQRNQLDGQLRRLRDLQSSSEPEALLSNGKLHEMEEELIHIEEKFVSMNTSLSLVRELKQSVIIARRNLVALVPTGPTGTKTRSAFYQDPIEQCRWLSAQSTADLNYMRAARECTLGILRAVTLQIEQARQASERRQHKMDLMQTILLGALLICLDAMHAFHAELPLNEEDRTRFQWPLISVLMAMAFALPPLFIHWRDRYGVLEYSGSILLGLSIAWVVVTVFQNRLNELPLAPLWIAGVVVLFSTLSVGLVAFGRQRQCARLRGSHASKSG
jgi:hypothetical protein